MVINEGALLCRIKPFKMGFVSFCLYEPFFENVGLAEKYYNDGDSENKRRKGGKRGDVLINKMIEVRLIGVVGFVGTMSIV